MSRRLTEQDVAALFGGVPVVQEGNVLLEANATVAGPRQESYGHPGVVFGRLAQMWQAYLGVPTITAKDVCMMLALLKIAREANQHKHDNLVDLAGYTWCADECLKWEERNPKEWR